MGLGRVNILRASRDAMGGQSSGDAYDDRNYNSRLSHLLLLIRTRVSGHWPATSRRPRFVQSHGHLDMATSIRGPPDYPPDKNAALEGMYRPPPSLSPLSEPAINHADGLQLPCNKCLQ